MSATGYGMPELNDRNLQITSRLPATLRERLDRINERYNTTDAKNLVALLEAFANVVEEADAVRFPVVVLLAEKQSKAAEGKAHYPAADAFSRKAGELLTKAAAAGPHPTRAQHK